MSTNRTEIEQQEIEKMAHIMCGHSEKCKNCFANHHCVHQHSGEKLYDADYRNHDSIKIEIEQKTVTRILNTIYAYFQSMVIDKSDIEQYTHTLDYMICKQFDIKQFK